MKPKLSRRWDSMNISRRNFLHSSAAFAFGLSVASVNAFAAERTDIERTGSSKKVVIISAGLAGLAAAYELSQAGNIVTVVEAQNCAGGRVCTLRDFPDGLHVEAGGVGYDESPVVRKYLSMFNLQAEPLKECPFLCGWSMDRS